MRWSTIKDVRIQVASLLLVSLVLSACGPLGTVHVSTSPPPSAAPDAATLLIRLDYGDARFGVRRHAADYLSDGTVIRWADHGAPPCGRGQPCGILETNTLTPTGLAALRARLGEDADLLASPRDFKPTHSLGGSEVSLVGVDKRFVLGPAGDRYTVTTPRTTSPGARQWVYGAEIERLDRLAEVMLDPERLVGPEGFTNAWTTYQPAKMAVLIWNHDIPPKATPILDSGGKMIGMPFDAPQPAKMVGSWPFDAAPSDFGMPFTMVDGRGDGRCGFVDSADIEDLAAVVSPGAGGTLAAGMLGEGGSWGSGSVAWDDKTSFSLWVVALLPEDLSASCADAYTY
jgi:hypothetical protein